MKKALKAGLGLPLIVAMVSLGGTTVGTAGAAVSPKCDVGNMQPCVEYCSMDPEGSGSEVPCGVGRVPSLTGRYTFSVAMDTATQSATGIAGDPGASGTANVTLDLTNNRIC